jgi:hypothetical protein
VSSIERCYPIDSASCPDRQHRVIVGRAQMRGVERGVPRTRRSGTTMIASPRNTACRARSANLSDAMGRNVSADLMSSSSLTLSFRPYTAGDDRGADHAGTKHRDLHAVALGLQPQRFESATTACLVAA